MEGLIAVFSVVIVSLMGVLNPIRYSLIPVVPGFALSAAIPVVGVMILVIFDRWRAEGEVIVEEISDEFEWRHRSLRDSEDSNPEHSGRRAPLEIRLVLRRFLSAARLPLAGEKTGPIFYLLLYLICEVALWFEFVIPARLLF